MSQHEEDVKDLLTIVNCSKTYNISKKLLCSKVPYFEGLLASNFKESKESKVDFQFDESSFDLFIKWINGQTELQFEYLVDLYDIADYLMIDELKSACSNFLYDKFTVDNLEAILNQVTDTSKLINTKTINCFINRNFLKIVHFKSFLALSLSTLEYVLKLDLWIESEYNVFKAIIKWIDHDSTSRKQYLTQLLKLIRWDQLDNNGSSAIRDNRYIKELNISDDEPLIPIKTEKENSRTTKTSLLAIYSYPNDSKNIAIFKFQSESWNLIGTFTEDLTLPTHIFCEDQSFDIFYDSGRRGIRVDWCNKTFRYLDSELIDYYRLMLLNARYSKYSLGYSHFYKWKDCRLEGPIHYDSLLESKGKFILLCRENYDLSNTHCCWPAKIRNDFKKFDDHLVQGACVKRDVFVYSRSYKTKLIRFAKDSGKILDLTLPQRVTTQPAFLYERCGIGQGRARCLRGKLYGNYLLASDGSQLALGIKSSKDFFFYDPQTTSWSHHPMKYSGNLIGLASVNWPSSYDYSYNETNKQSDVCKASDLNNLNSPEDLNHEDSTIKDEGIVKNHENNEENWPKRQRLDVVTT